MTKTLIAVFVNVMDHAGSIEAADTADGGRQGSAIYDSVSRKQDLHFFGSNNKEYFVPFHALKDATFERSTVTVDDPTDSLCVTESSSGGGNDNPGQ